MNYIFDDGSISSKVLQQEIEAQVIAVKDGKLEDWLSLISETGITKVYLHYCYEDYTPGLRAEIHTALSKNPDLRIICQYENIPKSDIEKRARLKKRLDLHDRSIAALENLGYIKQTLQENKDKIKFLDFKSTATAASDNILKYDASNVTASNTNFGKYSVGGNDSLRSQKVTRSEDPFIKKSEEFKNKRRRKKKE